ncbi:hypothetical protein Taro_053685 [Colocasia esculenta]|uniref:Uncharacterized protein n=1 Tax=Colocasia esculenta TaxID=4460 RepID=A0A843XND6_COLES|nr:hypothetical protein [Colocasia esculenta]
MGRCLNIPLKPSWPALARAKGLLDVGRSQGKEEFVEKEEPSSLPRVLQVLNPRRQNESKVRPRMNYTLKRTGTTRSDVTSTLVS